MASSTLRGVSLDPAKRSTPATEKAKDGQVVNNTGGYVFTIDPLEQARRFLILGSEDSFYQAGAQLSLENAQSLAALANSEKARDLVDLIVDVSVNGRAPKQSPGLFALALVAGVAEDEKVKAYAYSKVSEVCRTGSSLFEFTSYLTQFRTLGGSGFHRAVGRWYADRSLEALAYQMVKYRERNGFNHSRLLRLSKAVKSNERPEIGPLLDWALGKGDLNAVDVPKVVVGFELAKKWEQTSNAKVADLVSIVREYGLSWEMLPTGALNEPKVWETLLQENRVPLGALIRQLPRLTNLGLLPELGGMTAEVEARLSDPVAIRKARIHPLNALVAMRTYAQGRGTRQTWFPTRRIIDALERTFYLGFDAIEPTGKNHYLALDLSASMTWSNIAGMPITPREASATMAMVTARAESESYLTGFSAGARSGYHYGSDMIDLNIGRSTSLQDAIREIQSKQAGGTNLSLPMEDALKRRLPVDAFVIYTDNEVNSGSQQPFQALQKYRDAMGIPAKLIVVGMTATRFSIADPDDGGMLDVAGFDTSAPAVMADFVRD